MALFDVGEVILGRINRLPDMIAWLEANVGKKYGRGEGDVVFIGSGWEMIKYTEKDQYGDPSIIGWAVDITDPIAASHFALVWVK